MPKLRNQWDILFISSYIGTKIVLRVLDFLQQDIKENPIKLFFDSEHKKSQIVSSIKDFDHSIFITEFKISNVRDNKKHAEKSDLVVSCETIKIFINEIL